LYGKKKKKKKKKIQKTKAGIKLVESVSRSWMKILLEIRETPR